MRMPASSAASRASPSWRSASHCSQAWKATSSAWRAAKAATAGLVRVLELGGPGGPAGAVALGGHAGGDRLEAGVALERLAAGGAEAGERVAVAAGGLPEATQGVELEARDGRVVDEVGGADGGEGVGRDAGGVEERQGVDGDVERVQEAAVRGGERAAAVGIGEEQRVQRVERR